MTDFNIFVFLYQGSAADGPRGLAVGDLVTSLEDCPIRGVSDWSSCLSHLSHNPQTGYCVPRASLQPSWAHGRRQSTHAHTQTDTKNKSVVIKKLYVWFRFTWKIFIFNLNILETYKGEHGHVEQIRININKKEIILKKSFKIRVVFV